MALAYGNIDAAIAQAEGYNTPGTIPALAYNPGDIIAGAFATAHGATGSITAAGGQQIATFPDEATGYAATDALVAQKFSSGAATDIPSLAQSWLGSSASPTDVANWANTVASVSGSTTGPSTPAASSSTSGFAALDNLAMKLDQFFGVQYPGEPTAGSGQAGNAFSFGRVAAFVVGLLFILGGILSLKPAQNIVVQGGKLAARAGAVAAV